MQKIKIIAPEYLIKPLSILGIELYPAEDEKAGKSALAAATQNHEAVLIFITERLATGLMPEINQLNLHPSINIVPIPDNQGSIGLASSRINSLIRNSIGAEVVIRK